MMPDPGSDSNPPTAPAELKRPPDFQGPSGSNHSVPWRGLEPRCLSALPPQDSVSTSFTTRARVKKVAHAPQGVNPAAGVFSVGKIEADTEAKVADPLAAGIEARAAVVLGDPAFLEHRFPRSGRFPRQQPWWWSHPLSSVQLLLLQLLLTHKPCAV